MFFIPEESEVAHETSWSAESAESKLGSGTQPLEQSPVQAQSVQSVQSDQDEVERGRPGLQRLNMH